MALKRCIATEYCNGKLAAFGVRLSLKKGLCLKGEQRARWANACTVCGSGSIELHQMEYNSTTNTR